MVHFQILADWEQKNSCLALYCLTKLVLRSSLNPPNPNVTYLRILWIIPCPVGTYDISPVIYRWVLRTQITWKSRRDD